MELDLLFDKISCDLSNTRNRHIYHDEKHCFKNDSMMCRYKHLNITSNVIEYTLEYHQGLLYNIIKKNLRNDMWLNPGMSIIYLLI